ncbi:MAG: class I SAM-dependent methyltransferase [Caldilineaceae bacterium]
MWYGLGTSLLTGCRSVTGVDISEDAIIEAQQRYGKGIRFIVGSMAQLEFDNNSFDIIACLEGIEHVSFDIAYQFLQESARVLRADGQLFISSPYCRTGEHSGNPYHLKEYQPDELTKLLRTHLRFKILLRET